MTAENDSVVLKMAINSRSAFSEKFDKLANRQYWLCASIP